MRAINLRRAQTNLLALNATIEAACAALLGAQPNEDSITINLVDVRNKNPIVRRICHWIEYQFELFGTDAVGAKFSKGKINLAVLLDWERDRYLAYECKRLNVVHNGKRSSSTAEYVVNGMMRLHPVQGSLRWLGIAASTLPSFVQPPPCRWLGVLQTRVSISGSLR